MLRCCLPVLLVALLGGCGKDTTTTRRSEKTQVALVLPSVEEPWDGLIQTTRAHQAAHSADYELASGVDAKADQAAQVDEWIARHVQVIVVAPLDSPALAAALTRARTAGIVIVNIERRFEPEILKQAGTILPYVGPEVTEAARRVAQAFALKLRPGDEVAVVDGPTTAHLQDRVWSLRSTIVERGMKVVANVTAESDPAKAQATIAEVLAAHPQLKGVLCASEGIAIAAAEAVQKAGMKDQVKVAAFGYSSALGPYVEDHRVSVTCDTHLEKVAVQAIEAALQAIRAEDSVQDKATPVDLIMR